MLPQLLIFEPRAVLARGRGSRLPMCDQAAPSSGERLGPSRSLSETDASHGRSVGAARSAFCRIPGPFDEVVLLVVGGILWLFYRDRLREAWGASRLGLA